MAVLDAIQLASWINAVIEQEATITEAVTVARGSSPNCVVASEDRPVEGLSAAIGRWLAGGLSGAGLALPVPGDPLGLAGPSSFNEAALDTGAGVILLGLEIGLIPSIDARTLVWTEMAAVPPPAPPDLGEADRMLRQSLQQTTTRLADLDVASWQPEIPDLLLNLHRSRTISTPGHWSATRCSLLERSRVCLEVVDLARRDDGGAVSAFEMQKRRDCLSELDRTARRALVAACSTTADLR